MAIKSPPSPAPAMSTSGIGRCSELEDIFFSRSLRRQWRGSDGEKRSERGHEEEGGTRERKRKSERRKEEQEKVMVVAASDSAACSYVEGGACTIREPFVSLFLSFRDAKWT